jgi:hypothetical protein
VTAHKRTWRERRVEAEHAFILVHNVVRTRRFDIPAEEEKK